MSTHNICFDVEIRKILCGYPFLSWAVVAIAITWAIPCENVLLRHNYSE